jgi:pilus assembly protein CpaF
MDDGTDILGSLSDIPDVRGDEPVGKAMARVEAYLRRQGVDDTEKYLVRHCWVGPLEPYVGEPHLSDLEIGSDGLLVTRDIDGDVRVTGMTISSSWVDELVTLWRRNRGSDGLPSQPQTATTTRGFRYTYIPSAFSMSGAMLSVRLRQKAWTLDDLVDVDMLEKPTAEALTAWAPHIPMLISGGSGAGKTAVQEAILRSLPRLTRAIVVTQEIEFQLDAPRMALWEINPDYEGVTLAELVVQALKCQPDQIVVGEVRGAEASEWILALNAGVPGGSVTVHADGVREALEKMVSLGMRAGTWPRQDLAQWMVARRPLLVHAGWDGGKRRITTIAESVGVVYRQEEIRYSVEIIYDGSWHPERLGDRLRKLLE